MNRSIKKNVILNVIRQGCSIVFPLIIFPYISRVLGPENYGKYSFILSIVNYFTLFAMLGINTYAIREGARIRNNKDYLNKFASEITTINFISMVISIIVLGILTIIYSKLYEYKELLLILSFIIPCTMLGRDWINNIFEDFLYITVRYVLLQLLGIIAIFIFVRNSNDYIIYSLIYMISISFGYIINLFYTQRYIKFRFTNKINLKEHLKPISILFVGQLATTIYIQSDITMLGIMKTEYDVGIYTVASKIYTIIKGLLSAIVNVIIPRMGYYLGQGDKYNYNLIINKLFTYLFSSVFPLMVGLICMSKEILMLVGGEQYLKGALALEILGIALVFAVISGFWCNAILITNRQEKSFLIITVFSAMINIGLNILLIPSYSIVGAAITTLISEVIVTVLSIIKGRNYCDISIKKKNIFSVFIGTILICLVCIFSKFIIYNYIIRLIVSILVSIIIYYIVLRIMKNDLAIKK